MNINSIVAIVRDTRRSAASRLLLTVVFATVLWGISVLCLHFGTSRSTCSMLLLLTLLAIATLGLTYPYAIYPLLLVVATRFFARPVAAAAGRG